MLDSRHSRRASRFSFVALSLLGTACGSSAATNDTPPAGCDGDASHPLDDAGEPATPASEGGGTVAEAAAPSEAGRAGRARLPPSNVAVPTFPGVAGPDRSRTRLHHRHDRPRRSTASSRTTTAASPTPSAPPCRATARRSPSSSPIRSPCSRAPGSRSRARSRWCSSPARRSTSRGRCRPRPGQRRAARIVTQSGAGRRSGRRRRRRPCRRRRRRILRHGGHGAANDDAIGAGPRRSLVRERTLVPLIGGSAGATRRLRRRRRGRRRHPDQRRHVDPRGTVGVLNVPGYGGANTGGGGGGSGGGILLEAPQVTIDGIVAANGGGAGLGTANSSGARTDRPAERTAGRRRRRDRGRRRGGDDLNGADGT